MPRLIYIETSIPSFYFDTRAAVELRARRNWTRRWWDEALASDERVTSSVVIEELERAPAPKRTRSLGLIAKLSLLPYTDEVAEIVETYPRHKVMPAEASADADHLALATFHRCDMLVTWNCQHIANANKFPHIRRINALLGYETPQLVTPLELLSPDE
jgi:predicted nucleic acid-binding protein